MPVETLRPSDGRLGTGGPFTSAMPFRILNKGPNYFRRPAEPGTRKLSAVERLEADKAKYVKSQQVALTRQEPVKPPIIRKPLMSPGMMLQCRISTPPARKVPRRPANHADAENGGGDGGTGTRRGPHLNLEILNNLINVCDGPPLPSPSSSPSPVPSSPSPSASSPSSGCKRPGSGGGGVPPPSLEPQNPASGATPVSSCTSSPLNGHVERRPPPVPARAPRMSAYGSSPNSVTVRRVDVRPQAEVRKPPRRMPLQPQHKPRQIAQPQVAHSTQTQTPLSLPPPPPPPTTTTTTTTSSPSPSPSPASLPVSLPGPQQPPSPLCLPASPLLLRATAGVVLPPASPAFTRISSASSRGSARKHPALHRSKSDLSDRYSRATADLERFFNYCGLDPDEVEGMGGVECFARASSDIVSVSKMRSVSTPSSECGDGGYGGRGRGGCEDDYEDEDEGGPPRPNERVPYSISVIERNARVIKWLYGIRQARDASQNVSNV
ncbi:protein FAM110A [Sardina pilchardus]|uniref:protein FAM110A n=1 Tax=Sardina pilchardus TaxID=27697 RepID=UPI002E14ECDB